MENEIRRKEEREKRRMEIKDGSKGEMKDESKVVGEQGRRYDGWKEEL